MTDLSSEPMWDIIELVKAGLEHSAQAHAAHLNWIVVSEIYRGADRLVVSPEKFDVVVEWARKTYREANRATVILMRAGPPMRNWVVYDHFHVSGDRITVNAWLAAGAPTA